MKQEEEDEKEKEEKEEKEEEKKEEYTLPPVIEEEEEEEEEETLPCYCEVPMENCIVCDEAFAKDLGRQCDILGVEKVNEEAAGCEVLEKEGPLCERKKSKELEGIEEVLEAIDQKLGDIDQRFEGINLELEGLDQELEGEFQKEERTNEDAHCSEKNDK